MYKTRKIFIGCRGTGIFYGLVREKRTFIALKTGFAMRVVYGLITVFLVFCWFFARWYLCDIRGLCGFPGDKFPGDKTVAILEILLMLLIAFLIGFAVAWLVRENGLQVIRHQLGLFGKDNVILKEQLQAMERENQTSRRLLADWQHEAKTLSRQKKDLEKQSASVKQDLEQVQQRYENLKQETDSMRDTATELRQALEREQMNGSNTQQNTRDLTRAADDTTAGIKERTRSRFTPSSWETKDDLTEITGIGPVIQRKLNELGIYSFRQISEFTPEDVDEVAIAIRFFPGRIGRDNWIGQAAALSRR